MYLIISFSDQSIQIFSQAYPDCCLAMISDGEPPGMRLVEASPNDERQLFWETPRYLYNRFNGEALVVTCLFEGDIALATRADTEEQQWYIEAIHDESFLRVIRNKCSNFVLECAGENFQLIQVIRLISIKNENIMVKMPFHGGKSQLFHISKTKDGNIFYSALRPDCCLTVSNNDEGS